MADTNDLLKYGLLAVGGFFAYKTFFAPAAAPAAALPPAAKAPPPPLVDTKTLISNAAIAAGYPMQGRLFNWYQWDFFYQKVRGVPGALASAVGVDPNQQLSLDEYWRLASGAGFQGLGLGGYVFTGNRWRR